MPSPQPSPSGLYTSVGPFAIFVNDTPGAVGVLEDFVTNWESPFERNILTAAKQHGIWILGPLQMPLFDNKQD